MKAAHRSALFCSLFTILTIPAIAADNPAITFGSDIRYRYETITLEGTNNRVRHRVRVLANINAALSKETAIGLQLGSGTDAPYSRNQTLTGGFSAKQVNIDMAYLEYKPTAVNGVTIRMGKMKNPFYTAGNMEVLWDNDLRPEGITGIYTATTGIFSLSFDASYFLVDERATAKDGILTGTQARVSITSPSAQLNLGLGYYDYLNTKNFPTYYNLTSGLGNTTTAKGTYQYGFQDLDIIGEFSPRALVQNATLYAEYVVNLADQVKDKKGWLVGVSYGKLATPGTYALRYMYRELEKDAVIGVFTDDDFAGGGTNAKGHELGFDYQIGTKSVLSATYYINTKGIDNGLTYHRLMLDLSFRL